MVLAAIVLLIVVVAAIGWMLPAGHHAERRVVLKAAPARVFGVITDFGNGATWRSDLQRVEDVKGHGVGVTFREIGRNGAVAFRVEAFEPGRRLVTRIADRSLPYGGTWTFDLAPVDGGTALTIAEDGEVYNPIFRLMSRFIFSPTASMERYQTDLAKRLRE
jgi:hypothetical protein